MFENTGLTEETLKEITDKEIERLTERLDPVAQRQFDSISPRAKKILHAGVGGGLHVDAQADRELLCRPLLARINPMVSSITRAQFSCMCRSICANCKREKIIFGQHGFRKLHSSIL